MGGAQAAFGRFWVAGRIGSWSVLVFGAKWIIRGRRRVRCGRPACITNTCLWHNLRLVHRFEDSRGTRIINRTRFDADGRPTSHARAILVHRLELRYPHAAQLHTLMAARLTYGNRRPVERCEQPDRPVATRVRGRGRTGGDGLTRLRLTTGSAHCTGKPRGSGWDSGRTKLPNPRAPPTPSDADRGGGWERVRRDCRAEGSLEATAQSKR